MMENSNTAEPNQGHTALPEAFALDQKAIDDARHSLDHSSVTPSYALWSKDIVKLLNASLATELVCVLRYKRHHFTATGLKASKIADEFLIHAKEELVHADRIARRIRSTK